MSEIKCPFCNSTQISASKKGFSVGKAAVGAIALGGWGLLAGGIGKDKVIITCLNCGKSWEAGLHKVEPEKPLIKPESVRKMEEAEHNARIERSKLRIEELKLQSELEDLKFIEKLKRNREQHLTDNQLLLATNDAFLEVLFKLNRTRKQYRLNKEALTLSYDDIVGEELSEAISHILKLDGTESCYETLKQETIELAMVKSPYNCLQKMFAKVEEVVTPLEELAHPKVLHFKCMKCGQKYDGDQSNVGQIIECVSCGEKIELIAYDFLNK